MKHRIEGDQKGEIELTWRMIKERGKIRVQAKDSGDKWWYIFSVEEDGRGYLEPAIPNRLGLPLTVGNTLKLR